MALSSRRFVLGCALAALWAVQWLALVHSLGSHRVPAHVAGALQAPAHAAVEAHAHADEAHAAGLQALASAHEEGEALCQLLDQFLQLAQLDADVPDVADVAPQGVAATRAVPLAPCAPRPVYLARAPPHMVA